MAPRSGFVPAGVVLSKGGTVKTIVYIDGQNFLYKVAEVLEPLNIISGKQEVCSIDIPFLLRNLFPDEELEIRYYGVSKIRRRDDFTPEILEKSVRFADSMRRLKSYLSKTKVVYRPVGILKVRDRDVCKKCGYADYKFLEKGVDVGLAVELVEDVLKNRVEHIVLVSSDTDLMPAIKIAKKNRVRLTYVAFEDYITKSFSNVADSTHVLRAQEIVEAYSKTLR